MFLRYLNERQQRALLHYARKMVRVDLAVAAEKLAPLCWLTEQAQAESVRSADLAGLFCIPLTRVAFLLDVVLPGYVNPDFNPADDELTQDLTRRLGLDHDYLKFHYIDEFSRVFNSTPNDYTLFEEIENRYGVYIFKDMEGTILYVGEAHGRT